MPPKKKLKKTDDQQSIRGFLTGSSMNKSTTNNPESESEKIIEHARSSTETSKAPGTEVEHSDCDAENESETEEASEKGTRKIKERWFTRWQWLYEEDGALLCRKCVDSKKKNVFVTGCRSYKTTSMTRHETSEDHVATNNAPQLALSFSQAVEQSMSKQDAAMYTCIKTVAWLAKENVPMTKYEKMIPLFKDVGVTGLETLKVNARVSYDSYYTGLEILAAMSVVIDEDINKKLTQSPFLTILSDESTDLANKKRITLNAMIIDPNTCVPETVFLSDKEYEDGTGLGLATVMLQELEKRKQSIDKLVGFGSDGAAVMTGANKGVRGILLQRQPHLIHIHCMAHRLALCTSQAADAVKPVRMYQEWLTSLYYYFSKSASREQELHKIQVVLDSPALKYKEIHAVRWLSVYQAVEAVYRTIDPLITYLHQREMAKDPKSKGLLKKMATTEFVYITYLLMDILALVSRLCLTFQEQNLDIASAKLAVDRCLADLQAYKDGKQLFPTHLEEFGQHVVSDNGQHTFKDHQLAATQTNLHGVKAAFANAVIANIKSRFPQKDLVDAFFVLGMRDINMGNQDSAQEFGNAEVNQLAQHFGEEKIHKGTVGLPKVSKPAVVQQWMRAKDIVRSMKYPVDNFPELWQLLAKHHLEELDQIIRIAQIGLILPLHTADCERTFSQQNKILTKNRARLSSQHLDELIRVRLFSKAGQNVNEQRVLAVWKATKARKLYC